MKRYKTPDVTRVWSLYEKGVDHHNRINLYSRTEQAHRFFLGEQWYGLSGDTQSLPVMNIIQPTVEYKVATVAQNNVSIHFSPLNTDEDQPFYQRVCETLNRYAASRWEQLKMDDLCWQVVKDSCIAGEGYIYFYTGDAQAQVVDNTSVYLGDEQQPDLQKQPYIILYERCGVDRVRALARENGVPEDRVAEILPDEDTEHVLGDDGKKEVGGAGKCSCLLMMEKDEQGYVHITRATKHVVYQPDTALRAYDAEGNPVGGLKKYPIVNYLWMRKKGSARGAGEVEQLLANQIEINKTVARRALSVKSFAFPKLVYDRGRVENPEALAEVGASIAVDNLSANGVEGLVSYLNPAPISAAAENLTAELIQTTRDLAGAGDAATGTINPENASGVAIIAVRDQAQLPLNEQLASFRQFVEDIASVWYEIWTAYHPQGLEIAIPAGGGLTSLTIPASVLSAIRVGIRIDISSATPFSKYAQQQALDGLFERGAITFAEYVGAMEDDSGLPKGKLMDILRARAAAAALSGPAGAPAAAGGEPAGGHPAAAAEAAPVSAQSAANA